MDIPGSYIANQVKIEFRGTSTGEPRNIVKLCCICDGLIEGISFPRVEVNAVDYRKTLLDKMMLIHSECLAEDVPRANTRERHSRHWFDVSRMAEVTKSPEFAMFVKQHVPAIIEYRNMFFPKFIFDEHGEKKEISLQGFQENNVRLVPPAGSSLFVYLQEDYQKMLDSGMIYGNTPASFQEIIEKCQMAADIYNALPPALSLESMG